MSFLKSKHITLVYLCSQFYFTVANREKIRSTQHLHEMYKMAIISVSAHSILISLLNTDGLQESINSLQLDNVYRPMAEDGFQRNLNIAGSGFIFQGPKFVL